MNLLCTPIIQCRVILENAPHSLADLNTIPCIVSGNIITHVNVTASIHLCIELNAAAIVAFE